MVTLFFGDSSVTLVSGSGNRIERTQYRIHPSHTLRHQRQPTNHEVELLGRADARTRIWGGIHARLPIEVHAPCGFGKTTLLRSIAESGAGPDGYGLSVPHVYFEVGTKNSGDVLQLLVRELYVTDTSVRLSRAECARLVSGSRALLLLDDTPADPSFARTLVDELPGCGLVFAGQRPVLSDSATVLPLLGLDEEAGLGLLARNLGRPVLGAELPAARRLVAAVSGSPLQIVQAAALSREDYRLTLDRLAEIAEHDSGVLDRQSLGRLSEGERRALALLAIVGGARLPSQVIGAMGDIATVAQFLAMLRGRGLAEHAEDRFGLPVCRAEGYRRTLLRYVQLASAARALADWLRSCNPAGPEAGSGVEAAVSLIGVLAEQREWALVVDLVRVAEPVLFVWGRWEAWRDVLDQGIEAAQWLQDTASEAYFTHQKGTLEYGEDRPEDAHRLLSRARELRRLAGDRAGLEQTEHNLREINRTENGTRVTRHRLRRTATYVGTAVGVIALAAGTQQLARSCTAVRGPGDGPSSTFSSPGGTTKSGTASSGTASTGGTTNGTSGVPNGGTDGDTEDRGTGAVAEVSPDELTLAETAVGNRITSGRVTVSNTGDADLTVGIPSITGVDEANFEAGSGCRDAVLEPQHYCTITLTFAPQAAGVKSASLTVPHSASGSPAEVRITATAVEPPDLLISSLTITDGELVVVVRNEGRGTAPESMTTVAFNGEDVEPPEATEPIAAGATAEVSVKVPPGCYSPDCSYSAQADSSGEVYESDEGNNSKSETTIG